MSSIDEAVGRLWGGIQPGGSSPAGKRDLTASRATEKLLRREASTDAENFIVEYF